MVSVCIVNLVSRNEEGPPRSFRGGPRVRSRAASARPYVPSTGLDHCSVEGWRGLAMVVPKTHVYADAQLGIRESSLEVAVANITRRALHAF